MLCEVNLTTQFLPRFSPELFQRFARCFARVALKGKITWLAISMKSIWQATLEKRSILNMLLCHENVLLPKFKTNCRHGN